MKRLILLALAAPLLTGCATFGIEMPHRVYCSVASDECNASRKVGSFLVGSDIDERDAKEIRAGMKALSAQRGASSAAPAASAAK